MGAGAGIEHKNGCLRNRAAYAKQPGFDEEHQILRGILEQENVADELLSELAEGIINPAALESDV